MHKRIMYTLRENDGLNHKKHRIKRSERLAWLFYTNSYVRHCIYSRIGNDF